MRLAGRFYDEIDHGVPDRQDIAFIGSQYEFRRPTPYADDDAAGFGASRADYEKEVIAGNTFRLSGPARPLDRQRRIFVRIVQQRIGHRRRGEPRRLPSGRSDPRQAARNRPGARSLSAGIPGFPARTATGPRGLLQRRGQPAGQRRLRGFRPVGKRHDRGIEGIRRQHVEIQIAYRTGGRSRQCPERRLAVQKR